MLGLHIIPATPRYVIPVSGMIIGNSMILANLFLNRLDAEVNRRRDEIQLILALGGTPKQAIHSILNAAIKASMIPTVESQKQLDSFSFPA